VAQFMAMRKMMSRLGNSAGMMSRIPGMKKLDQMNQMRKMMSDGGGGDLSELMAGMKNPFKRKFQPEFSSKSLEKEDWVKLKNKRKAQRKSRKKNKKK
jgi:hypothetical protein